MSLIKLLIVDDQEMIRESLNDVFEMDEGIETIGLAGNGQEAIQICSDHQPNIVLMDIRMPIMDGVEATKVIKQKWPNIRVIILTTFQEINYVTEALSAGAEGYLLKAIEPNDLIAGMKLIFHGGTLISKEIAQLMIEKMQPVASVASSQKKAVNPYSLTERELEVLKKLADGLNNAEIAANLYLSEGTVKNYISNIYSKFDIHDRVKLAMMARQEGII
ncbi:response regulator [Bacillus sp. CGMCC 1.16607]|uniref:response regulator transcription factor n=1 Tax=Bacillus sp. CGMCC 1.16607 TaxID=3351842 RepID=UPI003634CAB4